MTDERYNALMSNEDLELTPSEIAKGWHFCCEWDALLIGPGMGKYVILLHLFPRRTSTLPI